MNDQEIAQKEKEVQDLQVEYSTKIEEVIMALSNLWVSSLAMANLFFRINKLCVDYQLANPLRFSTLTINNLTLFQTAHYFLRRMEEVFPEVCKKVKHEAYDSRFEVVYQLTK